MSLIQTIYAKPYVQWLLKQRFLKFGVVGASGTAVNLGCLYFAQEHLFNTVHPTSMRLNLSLAFAIFFATLNNFLWNRAWTWRDRKHQHDHRPIISQFGQYTLACWVGIALQFALTKLLALYLYYLVANAIAIVFASVFNFLVNDRWTFRHKKSLPPNES